MSDTGTIDSIKSYTIGEFDVMVSAGVSGRFHVFGWDKIIRNWVIFSPEGGLETHASALEWANEWLPKGLERPPARVAEGKLP